VERRVPNPAQGQKRWDDTQLDARRLKARRQVIDEVDPRWYHNLATHTVPDLPAVRKSKISDVAGGDIKGNRDGAV